MISNIQPDKQKSEALKIMADITLERLRNTNMEKYPSNTLIDYYDAIHQLMESLTLKDGIKVKGEGAHKELIDYVAKEYNLTDQIKKFLQEMRQYRNRISYEGFMINKNYISNQKEFIMEIVETLKNKLH
ncbi:MAG: hypothetical protein QF915_02715 [Candidatus Woesearchaeota archaeon]|jgi:uncharacterized protein (UPF0332 family)|nr:hypothetical protein [Candidatus Woesearchaeota archaeon]MDP7457993.1 hypothetical protein [Candidatus Woesearchaeota archaeon]